MEEQDKTSIHLYTNIYSNAWISHNEYQEVRIYDACIMYIYTTVLPKSDITAHKQKYSINYSVKILKND